MFMLISTIVVLASVYALFHYSQKHQKSNDQKFETLVLLRELLQLSRKHRAATHYALTCKLSTESVQRVNTLYQSMITASNRLIQKSPFDGRPMYRIYQLKIKAMHNDWQTRSLVRNQFIHGKTIRHNMLLMDELMITWLTESEQAELVDDYHMEWLQVLDAMETLTKLRMCIPDMDKQDEFLRAKFYADQIHRHLNRLALICPLSLGSPTGARALQTLTDIHDSEQRVITATAMYELTSDISTIIAQVYDQILSRMTETLYLPLPEISLRLADDHQGVHGSV